MAIKYRDHKLQVGLSHGTFRRNAIQILNVPIDTLRLSQSQGKSRER